MSASGRAQAVGRKLASDGPWATAVQAWVVARVLALAGTLFARVAASYLVHQRTFPLRQGPFGWLAWDGGWYEAIARHGYGALDKQALRFFPLYPMAGKALAWLLGGNTQLALLILANAGALGAGVLIYKLVSFETGDAVKARRSVWYLALFPASFVLVWAYAEPLFLCAAIGAFLAYRRGNWWWAALAGLAAALLRPVGCLLAIPALIELVRSRRREPIARPDRIAAVVAPIAGLAAYLAWVGVRFHDWALPYTVQEGLRGKTINPASRLIDGLKELGGPSGLKQGLHIPFALIFVVLVIVVLWRWPVSYGLFAAAVLIVSLGSANINSLERYALGAFPLILGLVTVTDDERLDRIVFACTSASYVALCGLALVGAYVP
ncbi:MAG: hypothetical protein ABI276_02330 [Acidimicrobiales bacterium]